MDKKEMLECLDKFDLIKEAIKAVDENIYMCITFTLSSFENGIKYHVCAIRKHRYVKFALEGFPDTYLTNEKTINSFEEVLKMLEEAPKNV